MPQTIRTFIAVEVGAEIRGVALDVIRKLSAHSDQVKWVDPDDLHFTLKFLGDVALRDTHEIIMATRKAVAGLEGFTVQVAGCGAFPNSDRPRTIWLGVREGAEGLIALQEKVDAAMEKLRYRREARRFVPHLTLGRVRGQDAGIESLGQALRDLADFSAGFVPIEEAVVYSSELTRSGPNYHVLGRAPLDV